MGVWPNILHLIVHVAGIPLMETYSREVKTGFYPPSLIGSVKHNETFDTHFSSADAS